MEFYSATCQKYVNDQPTDYNNNQIIIIANDYYEAQEKLRHCLLMLNSDTDDMKFEYKIIKALHQCEGIMIADGFDDSTYHYGISKYKGLN